MTAGIYSFRRRVYGGLKTATADLIERCSGLRAAGDACRLGKSSLANFASESEEHEAAYMPIDVVLQLETKAGWPVITEILAALQGHVLVPLPSPEEAKSVLAHVGEVAAGSGKIMQKAASALSDGTISRAESADIVESIDQTIKTLVTLREGLTE